MANVRHELQQQVVNELIESGAVNFEAVGAIVARHGATLAQKGVDFGVIINWRSIDICIPPDPFKLVDFGRVLSGQEAGGA